MENVKVYYLLSETGRKACLLAGGDGKWVQCLGAPATVELLDLSGVRASGAAVWHAGYAGDDKHEPRQWRDSGVVVSVALAKYSEPKVEQTYENVEFDAPQTVDGLVTWNTARLARVAAEQAAAEAALPARLLAWNAEREVLRLRDEAARAEAYRARDERQAVLDAAKTARTDAALVWIAVLGSARLRKAVALGLIAESMGVYYDERLAAERPGWSWGSDGSKEILNPSEKALDALAEARKIDPDASLWFTPGDHDEDGESREGTVHVNAQFLDRDICQEV